MNSRWQAHIKKTLSFKKTIKIIKKRILMKNRMKMQINKKKI